MSAWAAASLEGQGAGDLEGHIGGVDQSGTCRRTGDPDVDHRVPGDQAVLHGLAPFSTEGMNWLGTDRRRSCRRTRSRCRGAGLDLDVADGVLAVAARLLHVPAHGLDRSLEGLLVGGNSGTWVTSTHACA